jgi:arachidonate 15-lipoxygenase
VLRRVDRVPDCIAVDDARLKRAVGVPGLSAAGELAEGRLYAADYAVFSGARGGQTDGRQKQVWAPVALFRAHARGLSPVAIQIMGHGGKGDTVVWPWEGERWLLARTVVQAMDESHQGVLTHVGWCHMVTQRFIFAAHRRLAPWHPLMLLLGPHFENTLAVNQVARDKVMNPGGVQDRLLAPLIEDQLSLMKQSVEGLDFASLDPSIELARRGADDAERLPMYPFRDDGLPVWEATRAFVAAYLALYYTSDADVGADAELAAFIDEVGAIDGGRLPNLLAGFHARTVSDVVALAARIVFRASTYHAAINYSNYDWSAFAPNMPTAAFAPFPPPGAELGPDVFTSMLPSVSLSWEGISATYQVAELHPNHLGGYPAGHFLDPRVAPLVASFSERLRAIEVETATRNQLRPLPYDFLLPSRITASINA